MGLSIVHGIVESYGGFIKLTSKLNEGTKIDIYLPTNKQNILLKDNIVKQIPMGNERILFVDDEQVLITITKGLLTGIGYQVTDS